MKVNLKEISARFLEVCNELIENGVVENMKELCKRLDYLPQSMTQLKTSGRNVPLQIIVKLYHEFGGNPNYILFNQGDKILEGHALPTLQKNSLNLDSNASLVRRLEELVEAKNDYIEMLKKELERLKSEQGSKGK